MGSGANPNDKRFTESQIPLPLLFNLRDDPGETKNLAEQFPRTRGFNAKEARRHPRTTRRKETPSGR